MAPQLRAAAATAREALLDMAAEQWKADRASLVAAGGKVTDSKHKHSAGYGELTKGQKITRQIAAEPALTPPTQWKVAGKDAAKVNGRDFVNGKHQYTSDLRPPGALVGRVLRPTGFKAKLVSLDSTQAERMPGVTVVHDGDFIGVAAPDARAADQAVAALEAHAQWQVPAQPSNKTLVEYLRQNVQNGQRNEPRVTGSIDEVLASAEVKHQATYTVQYIAHTPLEPRAAVATWEGDKVTVWTGTQRPFGVQEELMQAFHLPPEKVHVMVPDTGSAYGGKHTGDAAIEAARLARAAGKPVRVVWSREEEFSWAYFRPAGVIDVRSGAQHDGSLTAWEFHNYNSGPAAINTMYNVANQRIQYHPVDSPLRQGSYRALAATANHFARESHMDELAHMLKMEPLEFRLKNLADPRLRAAFEAAAGKFGWGKQKSTPERGFGIAGGFDKGGYLATCAEIAFDPLTRAVRVVRVVQAFDCGAVVNPNGLRNLITGSVIQGLGGALFEAVQFDSGKIMNPHMKEYRLPRFADVPQIEVVLIDRKDQPSAGAGETPIVGIAPAVGNAIFAATGVRLRDMPLVPDGLPAAGR
jgi:isoquinoline 1-oxidoreductase